MIRIRTSECVSEGHPDKVADYLSDSVLDHYLTHDPYARVACEVLIKNNTVVFGGEITSRVGVPAPDLEKLVETALNQIGFIGEYSLGKIKIIDLLGEQSMDIAQGVNHAQDGGTGAGDQGIMFGYAINETEDLLPLPYVLARDILLRLKSLRKKNDLLGPDAKSQVSIRYEDRKPVEAVAVVLSTQHSDQIELEELRKMLRKDVIEPVLGKYLTGKTEIHINATGRFVIGGPIGDCGVTGRKIVVDSYGGFCPVGGGAFSGKCCTKVDRSAAYFARWVAAEAVRRHLAHEVRIELAYSIGVAHPLAVNVSVDENQEEVEQFVGGFDFRPDAMIERLKLRQPFYTQSTNYGHFTNKNLPWNKPLC